MIIRSRVTVASLLLAWICAACSGGPTASVTPSNLSQHGSFSLLRTIANAGPNEGDAYVDWNPIYPSPAYDKYEWTLTVKQLPLVTGTYYFWALQNGFVGSTDAFYFGLQPYGSCPSGGFCRMALFSFFGNGASSTSSNCMAGADGGPGESCHIAYNWNVGTPYRFVMKLLSSNSTTETWSASVTDTVAKTTTTIGNWSIPASDG